MDNYSLEEVGQVFSALGFSSKEDSWKAAHDFLEGEAGKYTGTRYPTINDFYNDIINGGSVIVSNEVSKNTIDIFFAAASHVAGYEVLAVGREWSPTETVWEVKDEE